MIDLTEVERYIDQRQKIQAIKELRSRTGLGLKDAKDAVEAFERDRRWPGALAAPSSPPPAAPPSTRAGSPLAVVEQAMARGRKIEAIKELRTLTGLGLKETKDLVDAYEAQRRWPAELVQRFGGAADPALAASSSAPGPSPLASVERAMASGQIILAIKELRERTNFGLKMSKEAVEEFRDHGRWSAEVLAAVGLGPAAPPSSSTVFAQHVPSPPSSSSSTVFAQHVPNPPSSTGSSTVFAQTVPKPPAADTDPTLAPVLRALESYFGHRPAVRLAAYVTRLAEPGHLMMLDDKACFVRETLGRWVVDPVMPYEGVTHVEIDRGVGCTLFISVGYRHERFEATPKDAEAALALFRVFAP